MVKKSKDMANLFLAAKLVGGTGGGEQPVLVTKNITENGIYSASADNADGYSQVTVDVPAPVPLSPTRSGATIYDFDGSVIATYTPEEFAALTEYPMHPTHEYLTGDGYNWSLASAKAYSAKYGYVEVGAQYRVTDGKTRLFIHLEEGRLEPQLGLGVNGNVDVDWGDGSAHDTMTGSNVNTTVYKKHTYAQEGDYIITLTVTGSMQFNGASGYGYILGKSGGNGQTNRVYLNALRSLYVGNSVTSIGGNAFQYCSSLTSISIPDSVTSIGGGAFANCYSLTSVSIPDSVTSIGGNAFNNCSSLTSVSIPDSVTSIGGSAFNNCYSLTSVSIPDSVTSIGGNAFQYCSSLTSVRIPDSVTSIGNYAFNNCYSLTSVSISDSVTSIGSSAFSNCYSLQSVVIPDGVTSIGGSAFSNCSTLQSVVIPDGVTSIGDSAFNNCSSLTSVSIPDSVTSIGTNAFNACYSLTSVSIPDSVTSIGGGAFANCYSLTSVSISDSVTSIGSSAFSNCYSLQSVVIPDGVTSIGSSAFSNCSTLQSVVIPDGVTSIGGSAFNNCSSLTSVSIPDSVTSIGTNAFSGCYGLGYIRIDNFQNRIDGSPWGAPSSDTVVIWLRAARFTSVTNEVSSGTTLTTSISCAVGDLIIATFVIRGDTYTISDDWMLLGISEVVGTSNQRTGMAYKIAESATENLTITQNSSGRIYTNLVTITGASVGVFSGFTTQEIGETITMDRPSGLVIWGVSASIWGTSTPYVPWGISNTTDIYAVELPISTQPRCLTALDQSEDSTISFTYSPGLIGNGALACASLTITGIPNFWYHV